jgi:hypothetical protein
MKATAMIVRDPDTEVVEVVDETTSGIIQVQ